VLPTPRRLRESLLLNVPLLAKTKGLRLPTQLLEFLGSPTWTRTKERFRHLLAGAAFAAFAAFTGF
jgi:hypothetical protein